MPEPGVNRGKHRLEASDHGNGRRAGLTLLAGLPTSSLITRQRNTERSLAILR